MNCVSLLNASTSFIKVSTLTFGSCFQKVTSNAFKSLKIPYYEFLISIKNLVEKSTLWSGSTLLGLHRLGPRPAGGHGCAFEFGDQLRCDITTAKKGRENDAAQSDFTVPFVCVPVEKTSFRSKSLKF